MTDLEKLKMADLILLCDRSACDRPIAGDAVVTRISPEGKAEQILVVFTEAPRGSLRERWLCELVGELKREPQEECELIDRRS